jgi:hypothetical protein
MVWGRNKWFSVVCKNPPLHSAHDVISANALQGTKQQLMSKGCCQDSKEDKLQ